MERSPAGDDSGASTVRRLGWYCLTMLLGGLALIGFFAFYLSPATV